MESYGVVGDSGGGGGVMQHNNNNSASQTSQASVGSVGLIPNMRLAFTTDGAAVYGLAQTSTLPASSEPPPPPLQPTYQAAGDGSAVAAATPSIEASAGTQSKRKRGRPRKYGSDGSYTAAGLTSPRRPPRQQRPDAAASHSGGFGVPTFATPGAVSSTSGKKRGRPPGSGKKHQLAALGAPGFGFTPHVITVNAGEDVSSKIVSFSPNGPRTICILSANGAISTVTLRQATTSGGTVTYEGRFEILSLSGSYMLVDSGGQRSRSGGLSVLLAGPDGRVLGGGVAGLLVAASPVQVVVGCFLASKEDLRSPRQADPVTAPAKPIPGLSAAESPASRGTLSESSGGPGSPPNQSTGACNINPQGAMATISWD